MTPDDPINATELVPFAVPQCIGRLLQIWERYVIAMHDIPEEPALVRVSEDNEWMSGSLDPRMLDADHYELLNAENAYG